MESLEEFKARLSKMNEDELKGEVISSLSNPEKLDLVDEFLAGFDPFIDRARRKRKGEPFEPQDDFIRGLQENPFWRAKYWPGMKYEPEKGCYSEGGNN